MAPMLHAADSRFRMAHETMPLLIIRKVGPVAATFAARTARAIDLANVAGLAQMAPILFRRRSRTADLRASSCLLAGRLRRTRMVDLGGLPAGDVRLRAWP